MRALLEQFGVPIAISAGLHIALGLVLVVSLERDTPIAPPAAQPEPIEATVVDEDLVEAELERIRESERQREQELEAARREAEELAARRAEEQRRLEQLQADQERAQQQRAAEREQQQRDLAEREARAREEQERLAELERQRRAEEERLAEIERQRQAEAERQRQAEAERQRQEAAERQRRLREAARQEALARYEADIRAKVERNWNRPADWPTGADCTVRVSQIPGGEVVQVRIVRSCGDPVLDRSVENAVLRASPLPTPSDPEIFSREIEFTFRPVE